MTWTRSPPAAESVREAIARACPTAQPVLGPELELHRHFGFSADDLRELLRALYQAFGTDFSALNVDDYAPSAAPPAIGAPTCQIFGRETYRSLTVGDIEQAVADGCWREAA